MTDNRDQLQGSQRVVDVQESTVEHDCDSLNFNSEALRLAESSLELCRSDLASPSQAETPAAYDVAVIVPTYCEAENLPILIPRIHSVLKEAGLKGQIIVVDDNSPDQTQEICRELAEQHPLRLEVRLNDRGLSTAVIHGMRLADAEVLVCMDADLSHPPEKLPELIAAVRESGVDFAIGSRYVPGASTDEDWGLFRKLNSKFATILARPLTRSSDPMAGFFALKRETFRSAADLDPVGYKIGLELLVKCNCRHTREIPIHFSDRIHGSSKLNLKEQLNYLVHLKRLMEYRFGNWVYAFQFATVGATGIVVDLLFFTMLLSMMPVTGARAAAIWIAMTWNFFLNRKITFSRARSNSILVQYAGFCGSCLSGALVNFVTSIGLTKVSPFFSDHMLVSAAIGVAAGFAFNFVMCRKYVFHEQLQDS